MKENYFLIHGSFGSPFVNWLPWLRKELRNRSAEIYLDAGLITENTTIFADTIATKQIIIKDGGHFNSESGYREFPELLEFV